MALKQKKLMYAKLNFKTSFMKARNIFVSYCAIFVIVQNKYENATSLLPYLWLINLEF
jgi:hypothetical protein